MKSWGYFNAGMLQENSRRFYIGTLIGKHYYSYRRRLGYSLIVINYAAHLPLYYYRATVYWMGNTL